MIGAPLLLAGGSRVDVGDSIARSLRFNSGDSPELSRTTSGSAGNRKTFTESLWVKRSKLGTNQYLGFTHSGAANYGLYFDTSDVLNVYVFYSGTWQGQLVTTQKFRDPTAWMHIVLAVDTTQATAADRVKLYVNGTQVTSFTTANYPSLNQDTTWNQASLAMGFGHSSSTNHQDCYCAMAAWVDGSALDPTYFGRTSPSTGEWVPKTITGVSWGTHGCLLDFADNTSTTTIGYDVSGNANHWTASGLSVTAGAGNDSLTDTPTNSFCTFSPIHTNGATLVNGGLSGTIAVATTAPVAGTFPMRSGKWYWEIEVASSTTSYMAIGVFDAETPLWATNIYPGATNALESPAIMSINGNKYKVGDQGAYGSSWTTGDIIGVALDMTNGKIWFSKNGSWFASGDPAAGTNAAFTGLTGTKLAGVADADAAGGWTFNANFGQRPFAYTAPTGFNSLCTSNLPDPAIITPSQYFNVLSYTGTGSSNARTGLGFQPDMVWIKGRSGATSHALYDSTRGVQKNLEPDSAAIEVTSDNGLTSFDADGFTVNTLAKVNTNTSTYVAWCWKEGIVPGVDVVTYTGNATNRTISHNLGVVPDMVIVKNRDGATQHPTVWAKGLTGLEGMHLSLDDAKFSAASVWNSATPTSSVFSVGTHAVTNQSGSEFVGYVFASIPGFSRFSTYVGNGNSDGPYVHCGFKPRWVMVKRTDVANDWWIFDSVRGTTNPLYGELFADLPDAEGAVFPRLDFTATGFKMRETSLGLNANGSTLIFAAFAAIPFKYARAR